MLIIENLQRKCFEIELFCTANFAECLQSMIEFFQVYGLFSRKFYVCNCFEVIHFI